MTYDEALHILKLAKRYKLPLPRRGPAPTHDGAQVAFSVRSRQQITFTQYQAAPPSVQAS